MSIHTALFLAAILIFVLILGLATAYYSRRARSTSTGDWQQILGRLTMMDRDGVAQVALDYADESGKRRTDDSCAELESPQIWTLIGGLEGLEALERNSIVLVDLAFYVQQWYPEALVLAEELRLSAREVQWHVERLQGAAKTGNLESSFADYAQPAIAKYYLMTRQILALYERGNLPMLIDLQRTI
ncbi:hypothetical protein [Granulicella sp. S156]|jgi:hypothetical protein|uniref:hypothetical protein n=1 Tax=Granulicella sp. S156 TaxID=1747224 RepID=UPI00131BA72C|nr:hypothetical protein [Granulicella sp. S156]